ncbi:MAG: TonB-dependent hemoglobin/transferrin/lactoferrin family receptor [Hyphomicrobiales bacterium]|nr:TonB-dependent hemoglobin/transferrin/lactoferrin family receptor [Hyphomicrobiales bacterium]
MGTAKAQDNSDIEETFVSGETIVLDPIIIYATLNPITSFEFPGQVSVVEREDLEKKQANSIQDILNDVPGVFVDGGARRSGQAPTIRGFREEDILILVDGVKQSFISGHDGRIFIDPALLKSAEIVKGPLSAIYGSGALGGVIALTTVDAADFLEDGETIGYQLKTGFQSANDEFMTTSTAFARSEDGKYDAIASFSYRNGGDVRLGNGEKLPEDEEIASSLLKATGQLTDDLTLVGTWVHYENDAENPNNPQANSEGDLVDRFTQSDTVSAKLSYNPTGNPLIDSNMLFYWAQHVSEEDHAPKGSTRLTERKITTTGINFDNRSRFDVNEWTQLTLTYGGEYYVDRQIAKDSEPLDGTTSNVPDADATYFGAFIQAEFDIVDPMGLPGKLKVIPGVRWDTFENDYKGDQDFDDYEDKAISPKLGVSYQPAPWFLMFGNIGSGFRAPSYSELYAQGTHFNLGPGFANIFQANPELKPQEAETYEAGLGFDFTDVVTAGDNLTIKGSYWHTRAENFIDLDVVASGCIPVTGFFDQSTCYSKYVNVERAELDGVEIDAKYDTARWFSSFAYTHIDGVNKLTGEALGSLQPDKIIIGAGIKIPEYWARIGTKVTFADDFTNTDSSQHRDAYTLVDVYASFEPEEGPWKGIRLDLGIDNLMDEEYEAVAAGAIEEGVNFKAAIRWTQTW